MKKFKWLSIIFVGFVLFTLCACTPTDDEPDEEYTYTYLGSKETVLYDVPQDMDFSLILYEGGSDSFFVNVYANFHFGMESVSIVSFESSCENAVELSVDSISWGIEDAYGLEIEPSKPGYPPYMEYGINTLVIKVEETKLGSLEDSVHLNKLQLKVNELNLEVDVDVTVHKFDIAPSLWISSGLYYDIEHSIDLWSENTRELLLVGQLDSTFRVNSYGLLDGVWLSIDKTEWYGKAGKLYYTLDEKLENSITIDNERFSSLNMYIGYTYKKHVTNSYVDYFIMNITVVESDGQENEYNLAYKLCGWTDNTDYFKSLYENYIKDNFVEYNLGYELEHNVIS